MDREIMYNHSSLLIILLLFLSIWVAYEICFHIGRYAQRKTDYEIKEQTNAIQAGILGLLALLLGFTFNMALQRFDNRSYAVIDEANTIGTTMLRSKLLPAPYDSIIHLQLQEYLELRLMLSTIDLTQAEERILSNSQTDELQNKIWDNAIRAAEVDPKPITTGNFIVSLNEMIDARGERNAILQRHVPELILFLLFGVFVIGCGLIGYTSGLSLKRAYIPTLMFTVLILMVVFIIIDLDRPKRGLIKVKQDSLIELRTAETNHNIIQQ